MSFQGSIIPRRIKTWLPADTATADARWVGISTDNLEWMLKTQAEHPLLPISEWLCYQLFTACGLSTPPFAVLDSDRGRVFGSRWEGSLNLISELPPEARLFLFNDNAPTYSAALALDLLIGNVDRHMNNFLYRRNRRDGIGVMVMDFSRALLTQGWPLPAPHAAGTNTATSIATLRALGAWDSAQAVSTLAIAAAVPLRRWVSWVDEAPAEWLPEPDRTRLIAWWQSEPYQLRLQACIEACK